MGLKQKMLIFTNPFSLYIFC